MTRQSGSSPSPGKSAPGDGPSLPEPFHACEVGDPYCFCSDDQSTCCLTDEERDADQVYRRIEVLARSMLHKAVEDWIEGGWETMPDLGEGDFAWIASTMIDRLPGEPEPEEREAAYAYLEARAATGDTDPGYDELDVQNVEYWREHGGLGDE